MIISKICLLQIFYYIFVCNLAKKGPSWVIWPKVVPFFSGFPFGPNKQTAYGPTTEKERGPLGIGKKGTKRCMRETNNKTLAPLLRIQALLHCIDVFYICYLSLFQCQESISRILKNPYSYNDKRSCIANRVICFRILTA